MKNRGITLIALIVTIIVLLVLAGVGISMLMGDNGILNKAKLAKEESNAGDIEEQNKLGQYNEMMESYITTRSGIENNNISVLLGNLSTTLLGSISLEYPEGYSYNNTQLISIMHREAISESAIWYSSYGSENAIQVLLKLDSISIITRNIAAKQYKIVLMKI